MIRDQISVRGLNLLQSCSTVMARLVAMQNLNFPRIVLVEGLKVMPVALKYVIYSISPVFITNAPSS